MMKLLKKYIFVKDDTMSIPGLGKTDKRLDQIRGLSSDEPFFDALILAITLSCSLEGFRGEPFFTDEEFETLVEICGTETILPENELEDLLSRFKALNSKETRINPYLDNAIEELEGYWPYA